MASRRNQPDPIPALPDDERRALSAGIAFGLATAAAMSAPTLYQLARLIGFAPALAWLLPAAFDGYAATSIWFGRRVPRTHPAAAAARRNARLALAMTIACNGLYHLLALAGAAIPKGVHIGLLVVVSSLPPFIVDRLLHLNSIANGTGTSATAPARSAEPATPAAARTPAAVTARREPESAALTGMPPAAARHETPARQAPADRVVVPFDSGKDVRGPAAWAQLALPLYRQYERQHHGATPSAPMLAAMLRHAHPGLDVPKSDRSARNIRVATEELAAADPEPEREAAAG